MQVWTNHFPIVTSVLLRFQVYLCLSGLCCCPSTVITLYRKTSTRKERERAQLVPNPPQTPVLSHRHFLFAQRVQVKFVSCCDSCQPLVTHRPRVHGVKYDTVACPIPHVLQLEFPFDTLFTLSILNITIALDK